MLVLFLLKEHFLDKDTLHSECVPQLGHLQQFAAHCRLFIADNVLQSKSCHLFLNLLFISVYFLFIFIFKSINLIEFCNSSGLKKLDFCTSSRFYNQALLKSTCDVSFRPIRSFHSQDVNACLT